MKSTDFKKLIKDAVREVIQEELKEILLEAVRTPKTQVVRESFNPVEISSKPSPMNPMMDMKQSYMDILGETALSFTSQDVQKFQPKNVDPVNGTLPNGELGMDQIMNLMSGK
jgi:hypothetical protein